MTQEIIMWAIIGLCIVAAGFLLWRRIRGGRRKKNACCKTRYPGCEGCPFFN